MFLIPIFITDKSVRYKSGVYGGTPYQTTGINQFGTVQVLYSCTILNQYKDFSLTKRKNIHNLKTLQQ
jgi:hypothetical protein